MTRPAFLRVPDRRLHIVLARLTACLLLLYAHDAAAQKADRQVYDIPALAVDDAVSRFSEISGIDVLLREPAPHQSRSRPVRGQFSPAEALHIMLEGNGLTARFTSSRSAIIVPEDEAAVQESVPTVTGREGAGLALLDLDMMHVTAPRLIGEARIGQGNEDFARRLAACIRGYVTQNGIIKSGQAADLRLTTRISSEGRLFDIRIVSGSRHTDLNRRVAQVLEGADLALPPPAELPQPLIFDISGR